MSHFQSTQKPPPTLSAIQGFLASRGEQTLLNQVPLIDGKLVSVTDLYRQVQLAGGYDRVGKMQITWNDIAVQLGYSNVENRSIGVLLQKTYARVLYIFEQHEKSQNVRGPSTSTHIPTSTPLISVSQRSDDTADMAAKRIRPNPPAQPAQTSTERTSDAEGVSQAVQYLKSGSLGHVIRGLNILTSRSADTDSRAVHLASYPDLITILGVLLDRLNPVTEIIWRQVAVEYPAIILNQGEESHWKTLPPLNDKIKALAHLLDDNPLLITIMNILRNMSMEVANERILAYHAGVVRHLTALILILAEYNIVCDATSCALEILANISRYIDCRGKKRLNSDLYLDNTNSVENKKLMRLFTSKQMSQYTSDRYMGVVVYLFPIMMQLLTLRNRDIMLRTLEAMQKLGSVPSNAEILLDCPPSEFSYFVEMICINTISDPYLLSDDTVQIPASIVHPNEICDAEVRDSLVDVLHALCTSCFELRDRIANVSVVLHQLSRLAREKVKTEASHRAISILGLLAAHPEAIHRLVAIQNEICVASLSDDYIAEMLVSSWKGVLKLPPFPEMAVLGEAAAAHLAVPMTI